MTGFQRRERWSRSLSWFPQVTVFMLLSVSFGFAMPAAVFATRTFNIGALGGGLAAFAGARWVIDMDYWVP